MLTSSVKSVFTGCMSRIFTFISLLCGICAAQNGHSLTFRFDLSVSDTCCFVTLQSYDQPKDLRIVLEGPDGLRTLHYAKYKKSITVFVQKSIDTPFEIEGKPGMRLKTGVYHVTFASKSRLPGAYVRLLTKKRTVDSLVVMTQTTQ